MTPHACLGPAATPARPTSVPSDPPGPALHVDIDDAGTGVSNAWIRWRQGNSVSDDDGDSVGLIRRTGLSWSATIPSGGLSDESLLTYGFEIRVFASDAADPPNSNDTGWIAMPGKFSAGEKVRWLANDTLWHLISIPGDLDDDMVRIVFGSLHSFKPSTGGSDDIWRLLRLDGFIVDVDTTPDWTILASNADQNRVRPGEGYWIRHHTFDTVPVRLPTGATEKTTSPFPINLKHGWNLFGNPFFFPVWLSSAYVDVSVVNSLQGAKPTLPRTTDWGLQLRIDTVPRLEPWKGYAIYCERPAGATLQLDPHFRPDLQPIVAGAPAREFVLSVHAGDRQIGAVAIGRADNAAAGSDVYDVRPLDLFGGATAVHVLNPSEPRRRLVRDIRPQAGLQTFEIRFGVPIDEATSVRWSPPSEWDPADALLLVDHLTDGRIDMTLDTEYVMPRPEWMPSGRVRIYWGEQQAVDEQINEEAALVPADFALDQNYPNPFNAGTIFHYRLPEAGRVRLDIYDVLGRKVATLVDDVLLRGRYTVTWDGVDARGRSLASGIYFARLQSASGFSVKKMVLLK